MSLAVVLQLLATYGPSIIPLIKKVVADVEAGKSNTVVTAADLDILAQLAAQTGEDIYKRLGITPPAPLAAS